MSLFYAIVSYFNMWFLYPLLGLLLLFWWWKKPHEEYPPGPRGLPVLGVLPFLGKNPQYSFRKWALFYGPVMSVRLGDKDIVFLNTYEAINEALVKQGQVFSGRPSIELYTQVVGDHGITFIDYNERQKLSKKFALQSLRSLGLGKKKLENIINQESILFLDHLSSKQNQFLDLEKEMSGIFCNIMSILVLGKRFEYNDPILKTVLKDGYGLAQVADSGDILISKPGDSNLKMILMYLYKYVRNIPPFQGANKRFIEGEKKAADALRVFIEEHRGNSSANPSCDFVSMYLHEQENNSHEKFRRLFTDRQLEGCVRDIVFAGSNDLRILLRWDILCLLTYPNFYEKVVKEIDAVIGDNEPPSMTHLHTMPITHAFLQEVWRYCPVVPNGVLHRTTGDARLNGFVIPKGTHIIPNIYAAHFDPKIWKDPMEFDPQRHIDEDRKFVRSFKIIPCGIGARFCLGRDILHVEEFIVLASLLRRFHISSPTNPLPPINSGVSTLVYTPHHYEVILTERSTR